MLMLSSKKSADMIPGVKHNGGKANMQALRAPTKNKNKDDGNTKDQNRKILS